MSIMTLSTNQLANNFTSGADENSYRSRQEKGVASVFCSKSKENALFLKTKHAFWENQNIIEVVFKTVVNRAHFSPYFSSFHVNEKRMLEILQINVRIEMTLQTMDKTVNFSCTVQFFVLGHVTVGVSQ